MKNLPGLFRAVWIALLLLAGTSGAGQPDNGTVFRDANAAYQKGDYQKARNLYERLMNAGARSAGVYYNLGNACYKLQDYASSVLYYEKALKEKPLDADIRFNLKLSRMNILDKEQDSLSNPFVALYDFLMDLVPLNACIVFLLSGLAGLLVLFWLGFVRRGRGDGGKFSRPAKAIAWLCLAFFLLAATKTVYLETRHFGVVMKEEVAVTSGPGSDFPSQFTLHKGSKIRILGENNGWYNIRFGSDFQGWMPADTCEKI